MRKKDLSFVWGVVALAATLGVVGCGSGKDFIAGVSSDPDLSVRLAQAKKGKGGGVTPNLVGTWDGTWTSSIPSGSTAPDSGTVHLVVTQQNGNTLQADITVYDPSRGESITDHLDNGSIKGNKVSFKGKRSFQRDGQTLTLSINFSGTVTGNQAQGTYSGVLSKGKGKGNKSEQDNGTWSLTRS